MPGEHTPEYTDTDKPNHVMKHKSLPRLTARKHGRTPSEAYRGAMSDSSILRTTLKYPFYIHSSAFPTEAR